MLKKFASGVLAALRGSTYRSVRLASSLAAALLAAFLNILRSERLLSQTCRPVTFRRAHRVFPQPANRYRTIVRGASFTALVLLAGCAYFSSPDIKRGDQHLAAGNWEEASLAYKQALKEDPFNPTLQGKYSMARERAAALYEERGRVYLKEHQPDLAAEQFKRALTIEPSSQEHQSGLLEALRLNDARGQNREADRLVQLGRTDEAMEAYA